ncbi:hypothetical protein MWH25_01225 [Natroniella acetigena]|uniref:hypothetical protein n=1 Tax=Natroniella acetigena TaxID=52004 RepID=UPI00200B559C|nr:hypothetical protein [Natroniella acetigena]MCK8826368.1 hypothetical protein [Natroniella acetigena]
MSGPFDRERYDFITNDVTRELIGVLQEHDITIGEANIALDEAKKIVNSKRSNPKVSGLDFSKIFKKD